MKKLLVKFWKISNLMFYIIKLFFMLFFCFVYSLV